MRLAALGVLGIPAQAVLGGITVLTGLNPWTVMGHFLLSRCSSPSPSCCTSAPGRATAPPCRPSPRSCAGCSWGLLALTAAVLAVGTVVTGSGPHSGDPAAGRTGLSAAAMSQLHADLVLLLVGATLGLWAACRAVGASAPARAVLVLLVAELAQGVVGFVQYFTDLPVLLVGLHLAGACVVLVAAVQVVLATRQRGTSSPSSCPPRRRPPSPSADLGAGRRRRRRPRAPTTLGCRGVHDPRARLAGRR